MKKLSLAVFFAIFLMGFLSATVPDVDNSCVAEKNIVVLTADRIIDLQNADGSWDWDVTNQAGPTGTTYLNIAGVTAEVLLDAYNITGNSVYLNAAKDTGDYLITQIGAPSSSQRQNAFNIVFLYRLYDVSGDVQYKNEADSILNHIVNQTNYWSINNGNHCADDFIPGCTASELLDAYKNYRVAEAAPQGIVVWDLQAFVDAAQRGGDNVFATNVANEMSNYMNQVGFDNTIQYYDLGLSAGVLGLGKAGIDYSGPLGNLLSEQEIDGSFDTLGTEAIQTTAYALMALKYANKLTEAEAATSYLENNFGYSGFDGWLEDGVEYSEVTSEAGQALFDYLYTPKVLGECLIEKTNPQCSSNLDNVTLNAVVLNQSILNLDDIWFSYTINSVNKNRTATWLIGNNYSATINASELTGGQSVTWNVWANDTSGFKFHNGDQNFYVRNATFLGVAPFPANGLNGWYVTEPLFTLIKDSTSTGNNSFYQWDSNGVLLYSGPFNLSNIPNPNPISAGTLELNWWTNFGSCGNETKQSQIFYVDLTNPVITNLQPTSGSTIYNSQKPTISALLDEVYGSNSGINQSSVHMTLDGVPVVTNVSASGLLDAVVSFVPSTNLSYSTHFVNVNVTDNAGRFSQKTWNFSIAQTPAANLTVISPVNQTYNKTKIPFNVSVSGDVKTLEYINYNDKSPKWKILCRDCDEYGFTSNKSKTLHEGENVVGIKALDYFGQTKEKNVSLFIDSKAPKISKVLPMKNKFTNGSDFSIKYTEDNVKEVLISLNPPVDITSECSAPGKNVVCNFQVDLSAYDGQSIEYQINMTDVANYKASTKPVNVTVDTTEPLITFFNHSISGKDVTFIVHVTETNFDEVNYIDWSDAKPTEKDLCTSLNGGVCAKKKTFKVGQHNITLNVLDDAGNLAQQNVSFVIA